MAVEVQNLCDPRLAAARAAARASMFGYGACALAGCLWSTGFYFGKLALREMSVEPMVLYRFLFATVSMLPVIAMRRAWRAHLNGAEWRLLLLTAALGVPLPFLMQFHGLARTTVSHASLMVGAQPVLLAAAAAVFAGERLDKLGWLALFGSTMGVVLVTMGGGRTAPGRPVSTLGGDLLVVLSLFISLAWILLSKKLMELHSPTVVTSYTLLLGTGMLAVWVLGPWMLKPLTHSQAQLPPVAHVSAVAWTALVLSGVLCTTTTTLLWNWGIHRVPASRAGVFLNIEPALGSVLGVELLGEHLGPFAWVGGALILGAAVALTTHERNPNTAIVLE